ncbi:MAG: hypothetical protein F6K39_22215 [Okeania sp. SIO3B3]|nr:hypothetical protein [Okeania sp. SIO3B3]
MTSSSKLLWYKGLKDVSNGKKLTGFVRIIIIISDGVGSRSQTHTTNLY